MVRIRLSPCASLASIVNWKMACDNPGNTTLDPSLATVWYLATMKLGNLFILISDLDGRPALHNGCSLAFAAVRSRSSMVRSG